MWTTPVEWLCKLHTSTKNHQSIHWLKVIDQKQNYFERKKILLHLSQVKLALIVCHLMQLNVYHLCPNTFWGPLHITKYVILFFRCPGCQKWKALNGFGLMGCPFWSLNWSQATSMRHYYIFIGHLKNIKKYSIYTNYLWTMPSGAIPKGHKITLTDLFMDCSQLLEWPPYLNSNSWVFGHFQKTSKDTSFSPAPDELILALTYSILFY